MADTSITTAQADALTAWLRDVKSIAARSFYQNRPGPAAEWVMRWIGQLTTAYAAGATAIEAVASCRSSKFSPLRMENVRS